MPLHQRSNVVQLSTANPVRFAEPIDEVEVRMLLLLGHAENSIFKWDLGKADYIVRRLLFTPWLPSNDIGLRGCFGVIGPKGGSLQGLAMLAVSTQSDTHHAILAGFISSSPP